MKPPTRKRRRPDAAAVKPRATAAPARTGSPAATHGSASPSAQTELTAPAGKDPQTELIKLGVQVIAPTTVISALLYYFGYVATRARFAYFGIDLDLLGLSQQALLMQSVGVMFPPLVLALAIVGLGIWLHVTLERALRTGRRRRVLRGVAYGFVALGCILLTRGTVGMVIPTIAETEAPATTPGCLALGSLLLASGRRLHLRTSTRTAADHHPRHETTAWVCVWLIVALSSFWAINSFAWVYGRGQATVDVRRLNEKPQIILDTKESLRLPATVVREDRLDGPEGQDFNYRSSGWRLYTATGDQMFLIPDSWQREGTVLLIPIGNNVRVQMYP
ncbi:hypothetical protein [Kineosporia babensis]|uniref:Uncharacterized protein n=1 Tax=Kineosporia babensis TaxID=499548 RepID=A0A9X1NN84_9ACTN|nr:hypothetical protein [Kineosporia babensis]MCD5317225.1 hypothetical protein [Kineosporia babensis]